MHLQTRQSEKRYGVLTIILTTTTSNWDG